MKQDPFSAVFAPVARPVVPPVQYVGDVALDAVGFKPAEHYEYPFIICWRDNYNFALNLRDALLMADAECNQNNDVHIIHMDSKMVTTLTRSEVTSRRLLTEYSVSYRMGINDVNPDSSTATASLYGYFLALGITFDFKRTDLEREVIISGNNSQALSERPGYYVVSSVKVKDSLKISIYVVE